MTAEEREQHDKLQKEREEAEQAQLPYKWVIRSIHPRLFARIT
jgi:hypothetical protein